MCKAGNLAAAKDLFHIVPRKGLQHNVWTYTIMINGLLCGGLVDEALNLQREMEEKGCPPNDCTYNLMIWGLVLNNEISRALQFIDEMVAKEQ